MNNGASLWVNSPVLDAGWSFNVQRLAIAKGVSTLMYLVGAFPTRLRFNLLANEPAMQMMRKSSW